MAIYQFLNIKYDDPNKETYMKSKIALITGGSRGLGKSMALHLAKKGTDIILTYNSKSEDAMEVVKQIEALGQKAVALQLDTSNAKNFGKFAEEVKTALKQKWERDHFNFLVNNAGVGLNKPFMETTEEQLDQMYNIHVKGVYLLSQKLLPIIEDGGRVLNVSSGLARFSFPGYSAYAIMKGAVETMTRYMAKELGARKITVNTIAPGAIETDFGGGHTRDNEQVNKQIASVTALGRAGLPDDIGGAVAMLLSDDSNWVNAQRIEVSGGMMI